MTPVERYRDLYEHEKDSNDKMLASIESVPEDARTDARYRRAVVLASHLAAARENWLDRMAGSGDKQVLPFEDDPDPASLRPRTAAIEKRWTDYLAGLDDAELARDFEFGHRDGHRYRWNVEGQIKQLIGHNPYHRGQIAMLVDQLGGETVDTDYVDWAFARDPRFGEVKDGEPTRTYTANPGDGEMLSRYRELYEHEKDSNDKMLAMIESVPEEARSDARYNRAVVLAAHLAGGRENWLTALARTEDPFMPWWEESPDPASLRPRFAVLEQRWTDYLAGLTADDLVSDFVFGEPGYGLWRWVVEGQIVQLVGHAPYHRGQIALLVDQLGGKTVDTDYHAWAFSREPRYGRIEGS